MTAPHNIKVPARWNGFTTDYPRHRCVHELFQEVAHAHPAELALIFGDEQVTYGELNARANQLAHCLLSLGVGPDSPVGICFERSVHMIVAMLAILIAGGAYVPLDPRYPAARLGEVQHFAPHLGNPLFLFRVWRESRSGHADES